LWSFANGLGGRRNPRTRTKIFPHHAALHARDVQISSGGSKSRSKRGTHGTASMVRRLAKPSTWQIHRRCVKALVNGIGFTRIHALRTSDSGGGRTGDKSISAFGRRDRWDVDPMPTAKTSGFEFRRAGDRQRPCAAAIFDACATPISNQLAGDELAGFCVRHHVGSWPSSLH